MRDVVVERLSERMADDPSIILLTGDLGFGVLDQIAAQYAARLINVGVAEQNMVGIAAGLALEGLRPFVYSIGNFPTIRALEQLRLDVCYHRAQVCILSIGGGLGYGPLGVSHHSTDDLGALLAIPGLSVLTPSTRRQAAASVDRSLDSLGPTCVRIDRGAFVDGAESGGFDLSTTLRQGSDLTILSYGSLVSDCLAAADAAAQDGFSVRVEALASLKPLDTDCVLAAVRRGPVIVAEEQCSYGGLTTLVPHVCAETGTALGEFVSLNLGEDFVRTVGDVGHLRSLFGIDSAGIHASIRKLLQSGRS